MKIKKQIKHLPIITEHMAEDLEKENRRDYFSKNRRKSFLSWAIVATALFVLAMGYNFYLLHVMGELILGKI